MKEEHRSPITQASPSAAVDLRRAIEKFFEPSRERSLALTKLDELELWLLMAPRAELTQEIAP